MYNSIARFVKLFLGQAGIEFTLFTAHSTKSASTSKGNFLGLTLEICGKQGVGKQIPLSESTTNIPT